MQRYAPVALVVITAAACSSSPGQHDYPKLGPGDGVEAKSKVAPPDAGSTNVLFGPDGSACLPTGVYDVTFDLSSAEVTVLGQSEEVCRSLLTNVPAQTLNEMKIEIEAGTLAIYWPERVVVIARSPCELEITSPPVFGTFKFQAASGSGVATFAVGPTNKPGERCAAKGAKLTLVRASS